MIYKIGEEIGFNSDFEIELAFSGDKLLVKQGDKGFLDSKGMIHYTTGQARGKIQKIKEIEVKDYAHDNISKIIFRRLNNEFNLKEALDDYDVSEKDFIDSIEDILMDIL